MEITNNSFSTTNLYQFDRNTQNKTQNSSNNKTTDIEIDSTEIEYTKGYDLENITPKETYVLANKLYQEEKINVYQLASMMIIGLKHEYSLTNKPYDPSLQNNRPFNLLKELEDTAANKANINFHPKLQKDIEDLIDTLLGLPEESLKISQTSIDISV